MVHLGTGIFVQSKDKEDLGEYRGFKLELGFDSVSREFTLNIKNKTSREIHLGSDAFGNIRRIDNSLNDFDSYKNLFAFILW